MRIKIRIDSVNEQHMRFTVFQDGGNAGQLCMNTNEARIFIDCLERSNSFSVEVVNNNDVARVRSSIYI